MPARDDRPMMGKLENWAWALGEARQHATEACRAPIMAIQAQEVWWGFLWRRRDRDEA